MIITISCQLPKSCQSRCSKCNRKSPGYDSGRGTRKWRAMDIGAAKVFVETKALRVKCKEHGVVVCAIPWARYNSRFVKNFEEQVTWLTTHTSKKVVSELMRIEWHTTGDICGRVYSELEKTAPNRFDGLVNIGIDETSYKKGHKYMTIVVNHDTNSVIWCHDKHGKEVLSEFFELLTPEQRESIKCVSADGARWIASCIEEYCPNAERCVDPFHVVSWAQDVMDSERRAIWSLKSINKLKQLQNAVKVVQRRAR
ncbi:TPA: transposase [Enterococcus faecium]